MKRSNSVLQFPLRFSPASKEDGDMPGRQVINKFALSGMGSTGIQLCWLWIPPSNSTFTAQQTGSGRRADAKLLRSQAAKQAFCHLNQARDCFPKLFVSFLCHQIISFLDDFHAWRASSQQARHFACRQVCLTPRTCCYLLQPLSRRHTGDNAHNRGLGA